MIDKWVIRLWIFLIVVVVGFTALRFHEMSNELVIQLEKAAVTLHAEKELLAQYRAVNQGLLEIINESRETDIRGVYENREVCQLDADFVSWMDYRSITNRSTRQWYYRENATTDPFSGVRLYEGLPLVAVSGRYGDVGDIIKITTDEISFHAVIGDIKAESCGHKSGASRFSIFEMIVDRDLLSRGARTSGEMGYLYPGKVTRLEILQ